MKRGPKSTLPSVKKTRGTFRPFRDGDKVEFTIAVPDSMPQKPSWLTAEGEEIWIDNVGRCVPPLTESDSVHFAIYCNIVGAIGRAFAVGEVPPISAMAEARKLGEFFGMVGAQSRVGSKASIDGKPNPFAKFKRGPIGDPNQT